MGFHVFETNWREHFHEISFCSLIVESVIRIGSHPNNTSNRSNSIIIKFPCALLQSTHTEYNMSLLAKIQCGNLKLIRLKKFSFFSSLKDFNIDLSQEIGKRQRNEKKEHLSIQSLIRFVHFYSVWLWAKYFHRNLCIKLLNGWQWSECNWIEHMHYKVVKKHWRNHFQFCGNGMEGIKLKWALYLITVNGNFWFSLEIEVCLSRSVQFFPLPIFSNFLLIFVWAKRNISRHFD